jgi:hypothetical protein
MNRLILAVTLLAFAPTATAQVSPLASHDRGRRLGFVTLETSTTEAPRRRTLEHHRLIEGTRGGRPSANGK